MTKTAAMVAQFFAGSDRSEDALGGGHFSSGPAAREDGASIVHKDGAANAGRTANAASHLRVHLYVAQQRVQTYVPTPTEPAQTVSGCVGGRARVLKEKMLQKKPSQTAGPFIYVHP